MNRITDQLDPETVRGIADEVWLALVGEDEVLVPVPGALPEDAVSAWVDVAGPWTGHVVVSCAPGTAQQLAHALLQVPAGEALDPEDVTDALGELANILGGGVKSVLTGSNVLGLPQLGAAPVPAGPADTCRVDVSWRGQPLSISVQGAAAAPSPTDRCEVPL